MLCLRYSVCCLCSLLYLNMYSLLPGIYHPPEQRVSPHPLATSIEASNKVSLSTEMAGLTILTRRRPCGVAGPVSLFSQYPPKPGWHPFDYYYLSKVVKCEMDLTRHTSEELIKMQNGGGESHFFYPRTASSQKICSTNIVVSPLYFSDIICTW